MVAYHDFLEVVPRILSTPHGGALNATVIFGWENLIGLIVSIVRPEGSLVLEQLETKDEWMKDEFSMGWLTSCSTKGDGCMRWVAVRLVLVNWAVS